MARRTKDPVALASEKINSALAPLKPDDRRRVLDASYALWGTLGMSPPRQGLGAGAGALPVPVPGGVLATGGNVPQPEDFMDEKQPRSGVERMACLAYYLTRYRNKAKFKTKDLEDLNSEAHQGRIANARIIADNATKGTAQYLSSAGGGFKQITTRGKALVEALPDRAKVKDALAKRPLVRRFRRKRARTKLGS